MSQDAAAVEQAVFVLESGELRERGRSPGFDAGPAERLCRGFGTPLPGVACHEAVFAQPYGPRHVAVVQVMDQPAGLGFRLLVLPRDVYAGRICDPFAVSDRFPPDWTASGDLPTLAWISDPPPRRTVEQLQQVLQTGGSTTLLGAVQALIDGGRLVFERPAPAPQLVRDLWALLPYSSQAELWPATFAYGNDLGFDVLVLPKTDGPKPDRYLTEEQVVDYPEGRYELALQMAVERGDQREVDRLLTRPSGKQTLRLALFILVGGALTYLVIMAIGKYL